MDGLKPPRGRMHGRTHGRTQSQRPNVSPKKLPSLNSNRSTGERYWLVRSLGKLASKQKKSLLKRFRQTNFAQWPTKTLRNRIYSVAVLLLFVVSTIAGIVQPLLDDQLYGVTEVTRSVLPEPKDSLATYLSYDATNTQFLYNDGYNPAGSDLLAKTGQGEPRIGATFPKEPSKGMTISDSFNKVDFTLTPKFKLNPAKQDKNQLFYPLVGKAGYLVYTTQIASIKEDIVLEENEGDRVDFEYELNLGDGLEARLEKNGSIGVYGSSLSISGDVSTGTDKDAELLQKARTASEKNKLFFVLPAPIVVESGREQSSVRSRFELVDGRHLKIISEGLATASYPLSIDPSVYVESAAQLMRGNNETNVEFDIATEQFKKASTTGARIDSWTDTTDGPAGIWGQSSVAAGGYVYSAGGYTSRVQPRIKDKKVTTQATASTNYVISMPDTRPSGDLYVAIISDAVNADANDVNAPGGGGWTEAADGRDISVYYKIGGGSEPATYTWTGPSSQYAGVILRITDFDSASPLTGTPVVSNNTTGSPVFSDATPLDQGSLQLAMAGFRNALAPSTFATSGTFYEVSSGSSATTASTAQSGFVLQTREYTVQNAELSGNGTFSSIATTSGWGGVNLFIKGNVVSQAISNTVYWAKFNSVNGSIESPAPGSNGTACSGWCTNAAYNLPVNNASTSDGAGLWGASMVAYNGYLYYLGGNDGTVQKSTVYVAKLGANGEPQLWHPSDPLQANWVYWNKMSTGLPATLAHMSTVAYDGKMYILGGDNNNTQRSGAVATVYYADILPNGALGTITATTALPSITKFATAQVYNGYVYIMGGAANGTLVQDDVSGGTGRVLYSKIQPDGSLGAWNYAAADGSHLGFTTPRFSLGGTMSAISGGYMYITGGCKTYTPIPNDTKDNCDFLETSNDVQLASINADGTLDSWNTIIGLRNYRFGSSLIAWQDSLYRIGGCSRQATDTGACYAAQLGVQYGNINQDGDASTVSISTNDGSGNCVGSDPYNCSLPPGGTGSAQGGQALSATAILNGYLYVIGGCTTNSCTTMSGNTSYAAIDSNGRLKSPPSCSGGTYGSWCVNSTNQIAGGIGAAGVAIFNGTIYLVGGQDGGSDKNTIVRNSVNTDGSLVGAWQSQSLTGAGGTSVSYTFAYARANPAGVGSNAPGNLYIFGGCSAPASGAGCTGGNNYTQNVYKCTIQTAGTVAGCTTTGQLQIGTVTGGINPGLGIHAGAVYANYIYLIGGVADGALDLKKTRYAKFDNNNNVVATTGSAWVESPVETNNGRRRGSAFGYNGYLYVVGGFDASVNQSLDSIEYVKVNVSDGSLVSTTNLYNKSAVTINQRWGLGVVVSNSYAYIIGGCRDGASPTCNAGGLDNTVQTFQLYNNNSGTPGGYTSETDLFATDRIGGSSAVVNGYIYIAGGCVSATDCTDATVDVAWAPIDSYGNIGTWTNSGTGAGSIGGSSGQGRAWGQLEAVNGQLYYLGGQSDSSATASDQYQYTDGFISGEPQFQVAGDLLPVRRNHVSATVWNNRIYYLGGKVAGGTAQDTVYVSPLITGGGVDLSTYGSWTTTTSFNVARSGAVAVAYANNMYIMGGNTGSVYLNDVQYAKINPDGTLGTWSYTTSLPTPISEADGFAVNGYMYLFGGRTSTNDCTPRTMIAPMSANTSVASGNNPTGIGEWYQTNRNYDGGRYGAAATYYNGKAFVLGGGCQGIVTKDDFDPSIDGTQWASTTGMSADTVCQSTSTSNTLRSTNGSSSAAVTNDVSVASGGTITFKLYVPQVDTGSCTAPDANNEDIVLQYSTNGGGAWTTIATYQENGPYNPISRITAAIPAGAQTASTRFRWTILNAEAADMFAIEDVSIIATASTQVAYTETNRAVYTTLLSQPQVAHYTRLIDAGRDVFPTKWLLNGIDNSIGARWQFKYRSMNDSAVTDTSKACGGSAMTNFGQLTNFGNVTLGSPETYTVRNASNVDIGCGRYFFLDVSIDASQTYGYPDDITRGPTLDNLTLFFKSNPGQRLIHGKTFIEGQQQPLDTQPGP